MAFPAHIGLNIGPLLWLLIAWALTLQTLVALITQCNVRTLIAWSIGIFGVSGITLRRPNIVVRVMQVVVPTVGASAVAYLLLTKLPIPPITGLMAGRGTNAAIALGGTAILSVPRLFNALAELRFPVWGEVRVLDRMARGRTLGNTIYFTAVGRAFLHDRFQMTPDEFLRIVRRRRTSIASGA